jgi:hypothetical protein
MLPMPDRARILISGLVGFILGIAFIAPVMLSDFKHDLDLEKSSCYLLHGSRDERSRL